MSTPIKPFKEYVLFELKGRVKKVGKIFIPETSGGKAELSLQGRVVKVGAKVTQVKVGDWIHVDGYSLTTVKDQRISGDYDAERLALVKEEKIMLAYARAE